MFGKGKSLGSPKPDLILLDLLNLFIAPLGGGAGAYVAYYFASSQHWNAAQIGLLLSLMAMCLAFSQIPAGLLVDRTARRNQLTAAALIILACGWSCMLFIPAQPVVLAAQILIGISCAVFGPAVASISLGLVGYEGLDLRLGRNGIFSHAGNVLTAILIGLCTGYLGAKSIVALLILFAIMAAISALGISRRAVVPGEVCVNNFTTDYAERFHPLLKGLHGLVRTAGARAFTLAALLYTFANASMLPLMVQLISKQGAKAASLQLPSSLLLTELVMIPVCYFASKQAHFGRRPLLIASYLLLIVRGLAFTFIKSSALLVAMQILDGISAGIFGLVITLVVADFCRVTGKFNATLSALYMLLTLANGMSEFSSGLIASHFGFSTAFAILTGAAFIGFSVIVALVPETKEKENTLPLGEKAPLPVVSNP